MSKRTSIALSILCFMVAVFVLARGVKAETLTAVPPDGGGWSGVLLGALLILALAAVIGAAFFLHRRFPSQAAKADAELKAGTIAAARELASAIQKLTDGRALGVKVLNVSSGTIDEDRIPTPAVVPGGLGRPGPITIQAIGDFAVDAATFQAEYFRKDAVPAVA